MQHDVMELKELALYGRHHYDGNSGDDEADGYSRATHRKRPQDSSIQRRRSARLNNLGYDDLSSQGARRSARLAGRSSVGSQDSTLPPPVSKPVNRGKTVKPTWVNNLKVRVY
jgi:hypothetical protein